MAAYVPTNWQNTPSTATPLSAANLDKLTDELELQALGLGITHSLPDWTNNAAPALTDPAPWNELERVVGLAAQAKGLSYTPTVWQSGWTPARNAARLNKLELQTQANRVAIDGVATYPANFYTGPLRSANLLPASTSGAIISIWCGVIGFSAQQTRDMVSERMTTCGRTFDAIGHQADQLTTSTSSEDWVNSRGSVSIIDWSPQPDSGNAVLAMNAGQLDSQVIAMANRYKVKPYRIMLRPWHEFNGNWFKWSAPGGLINGGVTTTGSEWIQGWRRMVTLFRDNGATNVGFCWTPTEGQDRAIREACYPGHEWVDWISSTSYNGCLYTSDWCSPLGTGWRSFRELFDYSSPPWNHTVNGYTSTYTSAVAKQKPFVITETGSKGDFSNVPRKGDWFRSLPAEKALMPGLHGIQFFDQDVTASEPGNNWRVDRWQDGAVYTQAYQGFADAVSHASFKVGWI